MLDLAIRTDDRQPSIDVGHIETVWLRPFPTVLDKNILTIARQRSNCGRQNIIGRVNPHSNRYPLRAAFGDTVSLHRNSDVFHRKSRFPRYPRMNARVSFGDKQIYWMTASGFLNASDPHVYRWAGLQWIRNIDDCNLGPQK